MSDNKGASSSSAEEVKLYRAFIFSVPILFTLILLFLFYLLYLRPSSTLHWSSSSLRIRNRIRMTRFSLPHHHSTLIDADTAAAGLNRELREMLPIIIYKESFSVHDTQCSVCLLEYQAEDRLQQIPACGHTFHMSCIDLWLASHSTCPLCRLSLLTPAKSSKEASNIIQEDRPQSNDDETLAIELTESRSETAVLQNAPEEVAISSHCVYVGGEPIVE